MANRLDIVIFGATGFTGLHCIPYVAKLSKANGRNLSWGVAGRSEEKLKKTLKELGEKNGDNFDSIPIITADIQDKDSIVNMAKKAKLVINCCGPYRFFGEPVVKACIEAGAHHVDVSGEPEYMEKVQLEHHEAAVEKGVYAISACGLDSIPSDLGVAFVQQNFEGTLNSVETYLRGWTEGDVKGPLINYGTWDSAVHGLENQHKLKTVRSKLFEKLKKVPSFSPKLKVKLYPHKSEHANGWVLPFLGSDQSVIRRSQNYFYHYENQRPVQVGTYFTVSSTLALIGILFYAVIFAILSRFSFGRKLLLNYPELFSGGFFSKEQPKEETIQNTWFSIDFYGEGWKEKLANKDDQYVTPVDRQIVGQVKGQNPGYGSTCLLLTLAGIIILTEKEKLPNNGRGGIYPPGATFAKTSLVKQLNENGLTFKIVSQNDI
ncbi:saccharopine dehydrogenase-like oxidoreductase [Sitophilus oryzae]|uniref:Saccharopine dehydrogenase-like oxidoreductase n=1 Tax=Sitophilus oryzae TaxID=7048 RepID=A0A6J2XBP5_SITOR|nr:saccharopine dehydrogenase-like oxidoreductase [Sitophilus oryzae]